MRIDRARAGTWAARGVIPLLAFVALAAWALSSPVGSSPDEDYHLGSIWCGQGTTQGVCEPSSQADERMVPSAVRNAACYALRPGVSPRCQDAWFAHGSDPLVSTDHGDFAGAYPPVFYFTMNFLVGKDVPTSVQAMRLLNAALFVALMSATYWLLPRRRRTMLVLGSAVALVPLGVFLIPSVNPSGWAITSAVVVFPALVGFFETSGRRRVALAALAVLAAAMGAGARADAAVFTVLGAALATLVCVRSDRRTWKLVAIPLLICAGALVSYLAAGQSEIPSIGLRGTSTQASVANQLVSNVLNVPSLWAGGLGAWSLGWLDTPLPAVVSVVNLVTFGGVFYLGIQQKGRRKTIGLVVTLGAMWFVPTWILLQSSALVGQQVQPRYVLPLVIMFSEVALFRVAGAQLTRTSLRAAGVALAVTNAISLYFNFRHYTPMVGGSGARADWWGSPAVPPIAVWILGAAAFAVALLLSARALRRDDDTLDDTTAAPDELRPTRTALASGSPPRRAAA